MASRTIEGFQSRLLPCQKMGRKGRRVNKWRGLVSGRMGAKKEKLEASSLTFLQAIMVSIIILQQLPQTWIKVLC